MVELAYDGTDAEENWNGNRGNIELDGEDQRVKRNSTST